jgi:hypothetical protein
MLWNAFAHLSDSSGSQPRLWPRKKC